MIMPRGDNDFVLKALLPIEDFNAYFDTRIGGDEIDTVAGLVIAALGRVPKRGEQVSVAGFEFEVLNADSRHIHLLRATRTDGAAASDED